MMPPSDVNDTNSALPTAENVGRGLQPRAMPIHPVAVPIAPPPAALSAAPNAVSLLKALQRRLGLALTVGLILAAVVGTTTWFVLPPPKLTARMQLHIAPSKPRVLFEESANAAMQNELFNRSQAFVIRDRFVLSAALRDKDIAKLPTLAEQDDPVQWLESNLAVEFPSPEFLRISLSGDRDKDLPKIVKAVTMAYLDNVVNKEQKDRKDERLRLEKLDLDLKGKWDDKKRKLRALQEKAGSSNEEGVLLVQQIAEEELLAVKKELADVHHKRLLLRVELGLRPDWQDTIWPAYAAVLNCQLGPGLPINQAAVALLQDEYFVALSAPNGAILNERELDELINKDDGIVEGKKLIQQRKIIIERMRDRLKPEAFEKQAREHIKQLDELEQQVKNRRKQIKPQYVLAMRQHLRIADQGERTTREAKLRSLDALESELRKTADVLTKQCKKQLKDGLDLIQMIEEIDATKKLIQRTTENLTKMEVEQEAPSRITLPSAEPILVTPDATKRKVMVTGGSALGTLALVLLAFAWFEFRSRKVYTPDEVIHGLGLQLMGTVPDHSARGWLPWSRANENNTAYTQSMLTESVDTARTMLLHVANQEKLQIVMITSALAGEGKTSLASHLAASLARSGRRTILVDSDLRNPTLHRLFERSRAPGLSEFLRSEVGLAEVTGETAIPNLWLIPAGKADGITLQALAFDFIPKLFEQLRPHYDFIIVDSCPVLPVADSMLVGQHVDAVIFSLLREVSRLPRVHAAYQRLAALGIRMLGAVVNGTQHDKYPSDYHYVVQE